MVLNKRAHVDPVAVLGVSEAALGLLCTTHVTPEVFGVRHFKHPSELYVTFLGFHFSLNPGRPRQLS